MKRHLFLALLTTSLVCCFTSCLKDDTNSTIIYSSQEIPDINTFMPHRLIEKMGQNRIHYGDEPPKFTAHFILDSLYMKEVDLYHPNADTTSPYQEGNKAGMNYQVNYYDQIKSIIQTNYTKVNDIFNPFTHELFSQYYEISDPDSTYNLCKGSIRPIFTSPDRPSYFSNDSYNKNDFGRAYIIGSGNEFTIYYYDVVINKYNTNWPYQRNNFYPVLANIISGKLVETNPNVNDSTGATPRYIIKNFYWGKEIMGYFNAGPSLDEIIANGGQPAPGDVVILNNYGDDIHLIEEN